MNNHEKLERVAGDLLETILRQGLEKLSYAAIARKSMVSRAWMYKYLGRDKKSLIRFSAEIVGTMFAELDTPFKAKNAEEWVKKVQEGTHQFATDVHKSPFL